MRRPQNGIYMLSTHSFLAGTRLAPPYQVWAGARAAGGWRGRIVAGGYVPSREAALPIIDQTGAEAEDDDDLAALAACKERPR